jgi:YD repeat-containing protein
LQDAQGRKFSETQNVYELKNLDGLTVSPNFVLQSNDSSSVYPALVETKTFFYEGQPAAGLQHRVTFEYDKIGKVTRYTDFGDNSRDDWVEATIQYHAHPNILNEPSEILIKTAQGLMRKRQTDIDVTGNVLQIRQYLKDGSFAKYDMMYDEYGNLTKVQHPENYQNKRFSYTYLYDNAVHSYVTDVTDAYGYHSKSSYEYLFGQVLETTDLNNQKMKYSIDAVGRIQTITAPAELAAGRPYTIAFEYHPEAVVPYAVTKHFDSEHLTDIETITFMDGLSRPVQVKKTASLFTRAGSADEVQWIVSGKNVYDALGRVIESYYPVTESVGNATRLNLNVNVIPPSRTTYDVLDRPLTKTLPDNAVTRYQYEFGADNLGQIGFKTTVLDALNHSKENYSDIQQRSKSVKDSNHSGAIWTNFTYNALSELLQVTDNQRNAIKYTYDQLGRKLSVAHPDAGLTTLKYDLANNLLEKVTEDIRQKIPNGGAIRYEYDYERLVEVNYPRQFQNKVQYSYGKTGDLYNRAGRIVLQQDASGGQEFYYGALGEVVKNIRTIYINDNQLQTFITEFEYDSWNRLKTMTYPDGEKLTYRYNRAGKLESLSGEKSGHTYIYVSQLGYDAYEQRLFLKYGNGTTTQYAYEPNRRRLSNLNVQGTNGVDFIKNAYTYDAVQNILSIQNRAPAQIGQLGGAVTHRFEYDDLYRLSKAAGNWQGNQQTDVYSLEMQYDDLHNIRSKAQTHQRNGWANGGNTHQQTMNMLAIAHMCPIKLGKTSINTMQMGI